MDVKSAMMTPAYDLKGANDAPDTNPFNQGAGHVDPTKFCNPGLTVTSKAAAYYSIIDGQGLDIPDVEPIAANALSIPSIAQGQVAASTTITRTFTGEATTLSDRVAAGAVYDDQYTVPTSGGLGAFGATPNPVPVTQGLESTFNAGWSGLTTGRYLGQLDYDGALAPTYVYVDVP